MPSPKDSGWSCGKDPVGSTGTCKAEENKSTTHFTLQSASGRFSLARFSDTLFFSWPEQAANSTVQSYLQRTFTNIVFIQLKQAQSEKPVDFKSFQSFKLHWWQSCTQEEVCATCKLMQYIRGAAVKHFTHRALLN